jgi:hypothetical protein
LNKRKRELKKIGKRKSLGVVGQTPRLNCKTPGPDAAGVPMRFALRSQGAKYTK